MSDSKTATFGVKITHFVGIKELIGTEVYINPQHIIDIRPAKGYFDSYPEEEYFEIHMANGTFYNVDPDYLVAMKDMGHINITVIDMQSEEK